MPRVKLTVAATIVVLVAAGSIGVGEVRDAVRAADRAKVADRDVRSPARSTPWRVAALGPLPPRGPAPPKGGETIPPVADGHNHEALSADGGAIDTSKVAGLQARGLGVVIVGLPVDRQRPADVEARVREELALLRGMSANAAGFSLADDPAALLAGVPAGRLQLLFSIEWPDGVFGGDPSSVRRYRDLGVRVIGLSEKDGDGLFGRGDLSATLTPFGTQVVAAMNEAGVLIDVTHLSHAQKLAVIARSRAPVVASHSLVQAVTPVRFNLPDEVVAALARSGGSVWVSFNRSDLLSGAPDDEALGRLVGHIEALVQRLGEDRVGIGTDLQAGGRYVPASLNRDDAFALIARRLRERGCSQAAVDGILGGNVLRALAAAASAGRSPSPATPSRSSPPGPTS
ncbi:MAG: membrane dipeptidase [Acidobacteria bacterium]|nr:membrane dipeptidase [Acidobacteriota bacterium]